MTTTQTVGPGAVWDVINGYAAYWAVAAASDLGIFDRLAAAPAAMPGEELAAAVGARRSARWSCSPTPSSRWGC